MLNRLAQILLAAIAIAAGNASLWLLARWPSADAALEENGLVENLQLLVLVAVLGACLARRHAALRNGLATSARLCGLAALVAAAMFYRESDFRSLMEPGSWAHLLAYLVHRVAFPVALALLLAALTRAWIASTRRPRPPRGALPALLGASAALLVVAQLADKGLLHLAQAKRLCEELLELNAYLLLLLAALRGARRGSRAGACTPIALAEAAAPR